MPAQPRSSRIKSRHHDRCSLSLVMQHHIIEVTNAAFIPHVRNLIEEGRTVRFRAMGWSMRPMIEHARERSAFGPVMATIRPNVTTLCWLKWAKDTTFSTASCKSTVTITPYKGTAMRVASNIAHALTSSPKPLPSIARGKPNRSTPIAALGAITPALG